MRMTRVLAPIAFALAALPTVASALITTQSSNQLGVNVFQQTLNNPCVIGDPSCKEPAGMTYTSESGTPGTQGSTYDLFSSVYLAGSPQNFGANVIPTSFIVGIDMNIAAGAGLETLVFFKVWECAAGPAGGTAGKTTVDKKTGDASNTAPSGCSTKTLSTANSLLTSTVIPNNNNGNGFSDLLLLGFSLTAGKYYVFEASVSGDTDGMEEFFLIPAGSPPAPEPGTLALLGLGLAAFASVARRRRQ